MSGIHCTGQNLCLFGVPGGSFNCSRGQWAALSECKHLLLYLVEQGIDSLSPNDSEVPDSNILDLITEVHY